MSEVPAIQTRSQPPSWPFITLALLGILAAIVLAQSFLMPVFLGFLLALTFSPVRRVLQRRGIPPWVTATLIVFSLIIGLLSLVFALSGPVQEYANDRQIIAADVERKLRGISEALETVSQASEEMKNMAEDSQTSTVEEDDKPQEVVVQGPSLVSRAVYSAPFIMAQIVFTLVLLFFLTASGDMFYEKLVQSAPTFRDKRRSLQIAHDIERKLSRYFLTITVINAGLGVLVGLWLWWYGMPNPLLFGVMAFALNFIPFLGAIGGVAVTLAIGIVSFDTVGQAAVAAGGYFFLTSVEGNLVTPYAVGRSLKMNAVLVFLAVAFWGWAWSVIGMFIAVPVLIAVRVFSEHIPDLKGLAIFLSGGREEELDKPPPDQETQTEAA